MTEKFIQVQDPNTGQIVTVANPYYAQTPASAEDDNEEDAEGEQPGPWCSIVSNTCPESDACVWWLNGEDEDGNDTSSCVKVAEVISAERANEAKADFFERAQTLLESLISADQKSSAVGVITNRLATLLLLSNEKAMSDMPEGVSFDTFTESEEEPEGSETEKNEVTTE